MKNGLILIVIGLSILFAGRQLFNAERWLRPILDDAGNQLIVDGRHMYERDVSKEVKNNIIPLSCITAGLGFIITGGIYSIKKRKDNKQLNFIEFSRENSKS